MLLTILTSIITLSILIVVHELGHFLVAKKAGVKVQEFGLGYPPRIWGKKIKGTIYSLNWIPFGGFVKLFGEELSEKPESVSAKDRDQSFWAKSKKKRFFVIISGVLANFLLGVVCFSFIYSALGIPTQTDKVKILGIALGSPAEKVGLKEGDVVLAVDEQLIKKVEEFTSLVDLRKGQQIKLEIEREKDNPCLEKIQSEGEFTCVGENPTFFLTPRTNPPEGEGPLGVVISNVEMKKYSIWQMPFRGAVEGIKEAFAWSSLIIDSIGKMFSNLIIRGQVPKDISGPVGIIQITGRVARSGVEEVIQLIGILSINLAIVNILPIPALDGGRLVFIAYEAISRRRPSASLERKVNTFGMGFLIFLLVLVTLNDVARIINPQALLEKLKQMF